MRLIATLLCASTVVSSAPVPPGLFSKALEVKNWVKAGGVASFLSGLKVFNEEAAAREDERQDEKQNLRDKAKATANYIVWYHLDREERESKTTNPCEFEQMIDAAKPIMKKKLRRRGNFLARLLTSTPSPALAEIYVREEIVKKMQDREIKMEGGDKMLEKGLIATKDYCDKKKKEESDKVKASGFSWLFGGTDNTQAVAAATQTAVAKKDERKFLSRLGGGAKAARVKFGKGLLVAVASCLLGVALLPF